MVGLGGSCDPLTFFGVVGSAFEAGAVVTKGLVDEVGIGSRRNGDGTANGACEVALGVVLIGSSIGAFLLRPLRSSLDLPNGDNGGALACFPARSPGERKGFGTGSLGFDGVPGADPIGDAVPARPAAGFDGVKRDEAKICRHWVRVD